MTACVAIASEARMDSSSTCVDNLHGCLTADDLDPSFRPGVGLLKEVDVLSAYMTAAAERVSANCTSVSTPDSAKSDKSSSSSKFQGPTVAAEIEVQPVSLVALEDLVICNDQEEAHAGSTYPRMELEAAAPAGDESAAYLVGNASVPSVQKPAEGKEGSGPVNGAVGMKVNQNKVGDVTSQATVHVENTVKEEAEVTVIVTVVLPEAEEFDEGLLEIVAENVKVGADELRLEKNSVSSEEKMDPNEYSDTENMNQRIQAFSNSTAPTSKTNPGTASNEDMTVLESSTISAVYRKEAATETDENLTESLASLGRKYPFQFTGLNHVAFCCESLERSLDFYCGLLGLKTNLDRPELPYRGAWLLLGAEGIHIMEVPNPDPVKGRPPHGGYDRHACLNVKNVDHLRMTFDKAGIDYQLSMVPSIFCRDPDGNGLEFIEVDGVHVE